MAVTQMKKLTVFAHADDTDALLHRLIRLRCVSVETAPVSRDGTLSRPDVDGERTGQERRVEQIRQALVPLHKHSTAARKGQTRSRKEGADLTQEQRDEAAWEIVRQTQAQLTRLSDARTAAAKAEQTRLALLPWQTYDLPLSCQGTKTATLVLGTLPGGISSETLTEALAERAAELRVVSRSDTAICVSVLYYNEEETAVSQLLSESGFVKAVFEPSDDTPGVALTRAEEAAVTAEREQAEAEETLTALAGQTGLVEALYDREMTQLTMLGCKTRLAQTGECHILTGWAPAQAEKEISRTLDAYACAYELSDPAPGDDPPILLHNNRFAQNFEWVLGMYSYPVYGKFDPTFIMSLFYFLLFGLMFADVGYGLIMTTVCFLGVKILKPKDSMRRFLTMFGYCGISCIIMGVIFGGWFGDLPFAVMENMLGIEDARVRFSYFNGLWFNPLDDPMMFLVVSLAVGALHLITGMAVQFWQLCRRGQVWDAVFDLGFYWLLFAGLGLLVAVPSVGKWVTIGAAALIVLTHGRKEKNPFMKLAKGLLGLYDLVSYASDLLSYSRVLALGLSAAVIGQVINILGTIVGGGVVGFIVLVVAFLLGHTLNLALNALGTFVHTSRLQYIEFLGKFYEDGGTPFKPVLPSDVYTRE